MMDVPYSPPKNNPDQKKNPDVDRNPDDQHDPNPRRAPQPGREPRVEPDDNRNQHPPIVDEPPRV